jgi:hypothetical protein
MYYLSQFPSNFSAIKFRIFTPFTSHQLPHPYQNAGKIGYRIQI